MEKDILKELKWPVNRKNYLGTLVYNLENNEKENFSDVVINRTEKEITVDFIDLKDDSKISLVIDRQTNKIDNNKTDEAVRETEAAQLFLTSLNSLIANQKFSFMPTKEIGVENNSTSQLSSHVK
jgi:hypothetical protein